MKNIETLEQAEEMMKLNPYLYLVSVMLGGAVGSMIVAAKERLPLYKVYFMVNETNKDPKIKLTITNVVELTNFS